MMSAPEASTSALSEADIDLYLRRRTTHIKTNDSVLLKLPSGQVRDYLLTPDSTLNLGKYGKVKSNELIGKRYGVTYTIEEKGIQMVPFAPFEELVEDSANNEHIVDSSEVQALNNKDILNLAASGASHEDIIAAQIESHKNFDKKTVYSKDKYLKKKHAKFAKVFTPIPPTIANLADYWINRSSERIRDLRLDSLSQMMSLGSVREGGRYIVLDDVKGLLTAAVLERVGMEGRIFQVVVDETANPVWDVVKSMNFPQELINRVSIIGLHATEDVYDPVRIGRPLDENSENKKDTQRLHRERRLLALRAQMMAGEFDGLLCASAVEPLSVIQHFLPRLAGSATIVIHSPHKELLASVSAALQTHEQLLGAAVSESWLRAWQVLPGRTHPFMTTNGTGGYIFSGMKGHVGKEPPAHVKLRNGNGKRRAEVLRNESEISTSAGNSRSSSSPADTLDALQSFPSPKITAETELQSAYKSNSLGSNHTGSGRVVTSIVVDQNMADQAAPESQTKFSATDLEPPSTKRARLSPENANGASPAEKARFHELLDSAPPANPALPKLPGSDWSILAIDGEDERAQPKVDESHIIIID